MGGHPDVAPNTSGGSRSRRKQYGGFFRPSPGLRLRDVSQRAQHSVRSRLHRVRIREDGPGVRRGQGCDALDLRRDCGQKSMPPAATVSHSLSILPPLERDRVHSEWIRSNLPTLCLYRSMTTFGFIWRCAALILVNCLLNSSTIVNMHILNKKK